MDTPTRAATIEVSPITGASPAASPLDRALDPRRITWEAPAWLLTLLAALGTRLIWLDAWPFTVQEAAEAVSTWTLLLRGQVSGVPPVETGPVVTLVGSLLMFLFGDGDATARLGPALAGVGLVAACWWLRPFLGRAGALAAALFLTCSPLALYSTRRLTPESYAVLGLMVLAICLLRLYSGGGRGNLFVAAVAVTLATFSHYLALPMALVLIVLTPIAARMAGTNAPKGADEAATEPARAESVPGVKRPTLTRQDWLLTAAIVVVTIVVVGIMAAAGGADLAINLLSPITSWFGLGPLDRAPLFIPLLFLIYEPVLVVTALIGAWTIGGNRETPVERMTGLVLVFWATISLVLAALAGDREPAQALYPLVPLALLAGRVVADTVAAIPWDRYWRQRGPVLSGVSALALVAVVIFAATVTSSGAGASNNQIIVVLLDFILALLLIGGTILLIRPFGFATGGRIVGLTALAVLALYGIRSATQLAFVQPASAIELSVQQQTAPGLISVVERVDRMARDVTGMQRTETDVTGGHGLEIAIDQSIGQPFDWYFRAFPKRTRFDAASGLPGSPQVVIVSSAGENALRAALERGYVGQKYPLSWSFPLGGIGGGPRGIVRYLLYREPATQPVASEYSLYLRRDLADQVFFRGEVGAAVDPATQGAIGLFDHAGRGRAPGQFDSPRGIAVDGEGNSYVVDTVNARVQKFDPQGAYLWSVGSTGNGPSQFGRVQNGPGPTGIAVDSDGNIYVADTWNHRIVKLDSEGKPLSTWGGFVNTQGSAEMAQQHPREFYGPRSVAVGPDNNLYVTDTGNKRVLVFDRNGQPIRQWGSLGTGPTNLNEPVGIAVDGDGTVYVADAFNARIATFDLEGKPKQQWPVPGWTPNTYQEPYIALTDDRVLVTSGPGRSVVTFDKNGTVTSEERRIGNDTLTTPTGIAVAPDGSVYIVDTGSSAVLRRP